MSTAQDSSMPSTAVQAASGLWRTSLQHHDLSVLGREMIQARVDIERDSPDLFTAELRAAFRSLR